MKHSLSLFAASLLLATLLTGCAGVSSILKSGKPDVMYAKALEYYEKEKWSRASTLFEGALPYYSGTTREDRI